MNRRLPGVTALALTGLCWALPALADNYSGPPTPCDNILTAADIKAILVGKTMVTHYSMISHTAGAGCVTSVTETSLYGFLDIAVTSMTPDQFKNRLSFSVSKPKPIAGVGDEAVNLGTKAGGPPETTETSILVRKGNLVCEAAIYHSNGPEGEKLIVQGSEDDIVKRLGVLCTKVMAARS